MEAHPQPYKLRWLEKKHEHKVTNKSLILIFIMKKYSDQVQCDVIPMDACHLLLDLPRQQNRKVQHDGFKNTYSFIKDSVNIILSPSKPELISKPFKGAETLLVVCSEIEKLVDDVDSAYALVFFIYRKMLK